MVHTPLYPRFLEAQQAAGRTRADFRLLSGPLAVHVAPTRDEAERGLHHIGYWTDDLDAAMAQAERVPGVGPFQVLAHADPGDFRFRGEPAVLDHSAAFAAWGPVLLELNVVHDAAPAALRDALGIRPGPVSHVAWTTGDLSAERQHLATAGCPLLTTSVAGAVADWFGGGSLSGHPIEVHQPPSGVLDFWASVRERSGGQSSSA